MKTREREVETSDLVSHLGIPINNVDSQVIWSRDDDADTILAKKCCSLLLFLLDIFREDRASVIDILFFLSAGVIENLGVGKEDDEDLMTLVDNEKFLESGAGQNLTAVEPHVDNEQGAFLDITLGMSDNIAKVALTILSLLVVESLHNESHLIRAMAWADIPLEAITKNHQTGIVVTVDADFRELERSIDSIVEE